MKLISLWVKKLNIISTRNCLQFNTITVILHKKQKYQEVKKRNILKCLCPHVGCVAP